MLEKSRNIIRTGATGSFIESTLHPEMVHMSFKNTAFRLGIVALFVAVGFVIVITVFGNNEATAENTINCRYTGNFGGYCQDVTYEGEYAYAVMGDRLCILDVSDPSEPGMVGDVEIGSPSRVAVSGNYAYVCDLLRGLVIVNVGNREQPVVSGEVDVVGLYWLTDIKVVDDYAYVLDLDDGLIIVDVSDKHNPRRVGSRDPGGYSNGLAVSGNYAYVAVSKPGLVGGMFVVDISSKGNPRVVGEYETDESAMDVAISGNYALVACDFDGLLVVNVTVKQSPTLERQRTFAGSAVRVEVLGDHAFMGMDYDDMLVLNIEHKNNPVVVGRYPTATAPENIFVSGDLVFLADSFPGVEILDIEDRTKPTRIGYYGNSAAAKDVDVVGNYAYIADEHNDLVIVDISDPGNPGYMGSCKIGGSPERVTVNGNYAYVSTNPSGKESVAIIDVSDKREPTMEGYYEEARTSYGIAVQGAFAYVANGSGGLVILDISDKSYPQEEGHYTGANDTKDVVVEGDYAYVADGENGVLILDISDTARPVLEGSYETESPAEDVEIADDRLFVIESEHGLTILDVSDRKSPGLEGKYEINPGVFGTMDVEILGNLAYVSDVFAGLVILDISDTSNPRYIGGWEDVSGNLVVDGHHVYLADDDKGLKVIETLPVAVIDDISPNPAQDTDTIDLQGHGIDAVVVTGYSWRSSIDGHLNDEASFTHTGFSNGTHTIYFKVRNSDDAWSDEVEATLAIGIPWAQVDGITPNPADEGRLVSFYGSGTDIDGTIVGYEWWSDIDGFLSDKESFGTSQLSNGTHIISFRVMNNHGVWSDNVTSELIINVVPSAAIDTITPNPAKDTETIRFYGNGSDHNGSIVEYSWRSSIDGVLGSDQAFSRSDLSRGKHIIYLKVKDNHGSWSTEVSMSLKIFGTPRATIDEITPSLPNEGDEVRFYGNGTDDYGTIVLYSWRSSSDGFLSDKTSFGLSTLSNGTHEIFLKVKNDTGAWGRETSLFLTVNGLPRPRIDSITPDPAELGQTVSFYGNGTDDGTIVEYVWHSSIDGYLSCELSFDRSNLSHGTHKITLSMKDDDDAWGELKTTIFVNRIPQAVIEEIRPDVGTEGDEVRFSGKGTDTDGQIEGYEWRSSVDGYLGNEPAFVLSTLSNGTHEVFLKVRDNNGSWSFEVRETLTIHGVPRARIKGITPDPGNEDQEIEFSGKGTDDGSITRYAWRSSIDGEFYNGTRSSFTYSELSPGTHTIYLRVRDNNGFWSLEVEAALEIDEEDEGSSFAGKIIAGVVVTALVAVVLVLFFMHRPGEEYEEEEGSGNDSWDERNYREDELQEDREALPQAHEAPPSPSPEPDEGSSYDEDFIAPPMVDDEDGEIILPVEEAEDEEILPPLSDDDVNGN